MKRTTAIALVAVAALCTSPANAIRDCSTGDTSSGACPHHQLSGGGTVLYVDCESGLAFNAFFTVAKRTGVSIPQLSTFSLGGDIVKRQQEDAQVTTFAFDPAIFSDDPVSCSEEVNVATTGTFQPFDCLFGAQCPEGAICNGFFGCVYLCNPFSPSCPSHLTCSPEAFRCVLPRTAIGPANVVETRRATPPTGLVWHISAQGVLDLLDGVEEPTGEKAMFSGNGRIIWDENLIPVLHDTSIELRPIATD